MKPQTCYWTERPARGEAAHKADPAVMQEKTDMQITRYGTRPAVLGPPTRRQALMTMLAGLLLGSGGRRALADQIATESQSPAKGPKSVKLFTMHGAGNQDGGDWENALPLASLSK